jgi:heme oxygenase
LRDRLRAATVEDHAALDMAVGEWRLDEVSDYRAFLQASADAVAPLELALEASGVQAWLPDWSARARRKALISDLEAVGGVAPGPTPLPTMRKAFATGLLYVLEGSRLGGQVLSRRVESGQRGLPTAYLRHGQGDGLWRSFLSWIESADTVAFKTDEAISGARYGFRCFADAFESARRLRSVDV